MNNIKKIIIEKIEDKNEYSIEIYANEDCKITLYRVLEDAVSNLSIDLNSNENIFNSFTYETCFINLNFKGIVPINKYGDYYHIEKLEEIK